MKSAAALKDFFGIKHLTNKDIAGSFVRSKLSTDKISDKFSLLTVSRICPENKETTRNVGYGEIRYDNENIPRGHGQYEPGNTNALFNTIDVKQRYSSSEPEDISKQVLPQAPTEATQVYGPTIKISEVKPEKELSQVLTLFHDDNIKNLARYANRPPCTFFFECSPVEQEETNTDNTKVSDGHLDSLANPLEVPSRGRASSSAKLSSTNVNKHEHEREHHKFEEEHNYEQKIEVEDDAVLTEDYDPAEEFDIESRIDVNLKDEFKFDKSIEAKYDPRKDTPNRPKSALDYIKGIRSGRTVPKVEKLRSQLQDGDAYALNPKVLLDSQGFRNYSRQVPDWDNCRHIDILNYLERSILYHNHDVLAFNKPYGLASHSDSKRDKIDMNTLAQELADKMRIEKVYLAHRLDKTTTGVLLFATSQKRADQLNKLFKSDQIKKTYWCITRGTPDPDEAIIDIPIGEYSVAGKVRSCLAPEKVEKERQMTKRYREARRAITEYSVIQTTRRVSLIEVKPRTGVKHQIRCHLAFGMNTPILGDHKYSHLGKLAPQELQVPVLNLLHLRQTKVRTLPLHLHAKTIVIPSIKPSGENLFISAPLPPHFKENLKSLKLLTREVIESQ